MSYLGPKGSRFVILSDTGKYAGRFKSVAQVDTERFSALRATFSGANAQTVTTDANYEISKEVLLDYNYRLEYGLDTGVLAVPFKLQTNDGTVTAGSTVGPYAGFRWRRTSFIGSFGLSLLPLQDVNASAVDTKVGITGAGGIIFLLGKQFQLGGIVGVDHLGGSSGKLYPYENKVWLSLSIGFTFIK